MRPLTWRHGSATAAVLLAVGALPACSTADNSGDSGSSHLTMRLEATWSALAPYSAAGTISDAQMMPFLYDSLLAMDAEGNPIPYLAESYEVTPTSISFQLRDDATCSDDTPLTPTLVKAALDTFVKAGIGRQYLGPGPYEVSADDATGEVVLTVGEPHSDMVYGFTNGNDTFRVVCSGLDDAAGETQAKVQPVGSGPYTITSSIAGQQIELARRPGWSWGPDDSTFEDLPEKITMKVVAENTTAANLLNTGGLDLGRIFGTDQERLQANDDLTHAAGLNLNATQLLFMESKDRPTADPVIREAIMTAIDKEAFNQAAYNGYAEVSSSVLSEAAPCYEPATEELLPQYDVDAAKKVLADGGYTQEDGKLMKDGSPVPAIRVLTGSQGEGSGPEYIADQLRKIGLPVDYKEMDNTTWSTAFISSEWDVQMFPGLSGTPNFPYFTQTVGPDSFSKTRDPELEAAYARSQATTDEEKCDAVKEIQRLWIEKAHTLPLSITQDNYYAKDGISWITSAGYIIQPWSIRID